MEPKPVRIQRKRTRGFSLQGASPNGLPVVYVGRGTKWGNPVRVRKGNHILTAENAKECYRIWITETEGRTIGYHAGFELRGKNLACWCGLYDRTGARIPCHADILLSIANSIPLEEICAPLTTANSQNSHAKSASK